MKDYDDMPLPYVKALTSEVKETKQIIKETKEKMDLRKKENQDYYEPANVLFESVRNTHREFDARAEAVLQKINDEKEELLRLKRCNEDNLTELQKSAEVFRQESEENKDQPLGIAIRAIAAMFPFVAFGLFTICSKKADE